MSAKHLRLTFLVLSAWLLAGPGPVVADQKIKTKSNIKNDRVAEASSSSSSSASSAPKSSQVTGER